MMEARQPIETIGEANICASAAEGQRPDLPGSQGEHELQESLGTLKRARAFYNNQVLDHVNPQMCEFLARQEMMFVATADTAGNCDWRKESQPAIGRNHAGFSNSWSKAPRTTQL